MSIFRLPKSGSCAGPLRVNLFANNPFAISSQALPIQNSLLYLLISLADLNWHSRYYLPGLASLHNLKLSRL